MDRWIIFGLAVCHQHLNQPPIEKLWPLAMQNSLTTQLFRDEVIMTHQYIQSYFETIKGSVTCIYALQFFLAYYIFLF